MNKTGSSDCGLSKAASTRSCLLHRRNASLSIEGIRKPCSASCTTASCITADITTPDNASCRASSIQHQWAAAVYAVSLSAIRICSLYSSGTSKQRNNGKEQESPFHEESCSSWMRYAFRITRILCFSSVLSGCSLRNSYENIVSIQSLFLCLKFYHSLHHPHNLL